MLNYAIKADEAVFRSVMVLDSLCIASVCVWFESHTDESAV